MHVDESQKNKNLGRLYRLAHHKKTHSNRIDNSNFGIEHSARLEDSQSQHEI